MKSIAPITLATAVALAMGPGISLAQERGLVLEEIIVTATKREQSLQDVSVAVTALSDADIRGAHINSSEDLTFMVPSLNLQKGSNPRQSSFNIRGIGTQSFSTAVEPSVSTMLDGVVMGRSGQAFMQLLDIQRVEVLRGPQGTLFGKNATGGVIHIITENPSEEHSGELMGAVLNDDEYRAGFTVSGPLNDQLAYRLSASGSSVDGFTKNHYDGKYYNGSEDWNVRAKLRWTPSDTLELKWASDYSDQDCDCTAAPLRSLEPYGGNEDTVQAILDRIAPTTPGKENTEVTINREPGTQSSQWGHALEVNWDIGDFTLTSITARRAFENDAVDGDLDGQPIDIMGFDQFGATEQDQFTQELRITSPAAGNFTYVAGLFYFDQEVNRRFERRFEFVPGMPGEGVSTFQVDTRNWAVFGEATWAFNDAWRLIVGARYTEDELDYVFERTRDGLTIGLPEPVAPAKNGTDEDDLSGKVALQWDFNDEGMAYLSYTQGYKGPAYDITFGTIPEDVHRIEPEISDSWELGLKTTLLDGQVMLNAALFHTEYEDFQSQAYFDPDGDPGCPYDNPGCDPDNDPGGFLLINAGEVSSEGLELDFVAQVTENLRLFGGLALIDASIDDYPAGPCSDPQKYRGECPDGLQDLSGGDLPFSPDWKASLTAAYTWFRADSFDVVFRGSVRAQDDIQFNLHQDENTIADSYAIYDASVTLIDQDDRWNVTLFAKNLTDEFYPSNIFSLPAVFIPNAYFHRYSKSAERGYGLEMRYRW